MITWQIQNPGSVLGQVSLTLSAKRIGKLSEHILVTWKPISPLFGLEPERYCLLNCRYNCLGLAIFNDTLLRTQCQPISSFGICNKPCVKPLFLNFCKYSYFLTNQGCQLESCWGNIAANKF